MQTILGAFLKNAESAPNHCAISFYGARASYGVLAARAAILGAAIGARNGVVLIFLPQGPDAIAAFMGLMWAGAVPSFMPLPSAKQDPALYWASHAELLRHIEPAALITTRAHANVMRANGLDKLVAEIVAVEDVEVSHTAALSSRDAPPARAITLLQHSSGTTALKKGIALGDSAVCDQVASYAKALNASAHDVVASWLPLYHDMGLVAGTLLPLMLGQTIALLDPFRWVARPASLFEAIASERATLCWLPNFAFAHLARTVAPDAVRHDLSSMRAFINCSEPCKPATIAAFEARFGALGATGDKLQTCYAMAETVFAVTQTPTGFAPRVFRAASEALAEGYAKESPETSAISLLSSGSPVKGVEIVVQGDNGEALSEGHVGEFVVRAPFLFSGYYRRPDLTAEKFVDGAYRTGDLGFLLGGEAFVLGRKDDLLIIHGRNFFAHEIEAIAARVPGIKPGRVVAIGVYNDVVGSEDLILIAEQDESVNESESRILRVRLRGEVLQALGADARDVHLVAPGWLVKTTSGKISRRENKAKYLKETA